MLRYGALSDSEVFRRQNYSIVTGPSLRHNRTQQGQGVAAIHSVTVSTCADPKMRGAFLDLMTKMINDPAAVAAAQIHLFNEAVSVPVHHADSIAGAH